MDVLSQYSFKVKFLRGKDMAISHFLSMHPGQNLASPNKIIPIFFQNKELLNNTDICCLVKKPPTPVKRVTRRTAQPGEVAPLWPLTGETRRPEHVPQHNNSNQLRDKYNLTNLWCKQKYMLQWNHQNQRFQLMLKD